MSVELRFSQVEVGHAFNWGGDEYQKTRIYARKKYGFVNCRLVLKRYYEGDTGYRRLHQDVIVRVEK